MPVYRHSSALASYFDEHVSAAQRDAANRFVLDDMKSHLDEQDAEEGRWERPTERVSAANLMRC